MSYDTHAVRASRTTSRPYHSRHFARIRAHLAVFDTAREAIFIADTARNIVAVNRCGISSAGFE